jgi:hypothetical protein
MFTSEKISISSYFIFNFKLSEKKLSNLNVFLNTLIFTWFKIFILYF